MMRPRWFIGIFLACDGGEEIGEIVHIEEL